MQGVFELLDDVSSIERTYNSNHTLTTLRFSNYAKLEKHIASAININEENRGNSHAAERAKVIVTKLNSITRKELFSLQGVEYTCSRIYSQMSLFPCRTSLHWLGKVWTE